MAEFTLYYGDKAADRISFLPNLERDRLVDMLMYLCPDKKSDAVEFLLTFKYQDIVLLRDYLSSVIRLFEKQCVSDK